MSGLIVREREHICGTPSDIQSERSTAMRIFQTDASDMPTMRTRLDTAPRRRMPHHHQASFWTSGSAEARAPWLPRNPVKCYLSRAVSWEQCQLKSLPRLTAKRFECLRRLKSCASLSPRRCHRLYRHASNSCMAAGDYPHAYWTRRAC
jgi:hypothetical protein